MAQNDRTLGLIGNSGLKVPCVVATTANITLSGEQTIDGVAVVESNAASLPDRVLVKEQTDTTENGVYDVVASGAWTRSKDFNGTYDVVSGTLVTTLQGTTNAPTTWKLTTADPITIGTSSITFSSPAFEFTDVSAQTVVSSSGSTARTLAARADDVFSVLDHGGATDTGLQAAIDAAEANGAGAVEIPANTTVAIGTTEITVGSNITIFGYGDSSVISATGAGRGPGDNLLRNDDQVSGNANIQIRDLRIFGDRNNQTSEIVGVDLQNCSECVVDNVTVADHGIGIKLTSCTDTRITGNRFVQETSNKSGIALARDSNINERILIANNLFNGTREEAIDINAGSENVIIDGNIFYNNHTANDPDTAENAEVIDIGASSAPRINDVIISNNTLDLQGAARTGIWVKQNSSRIKITGNTIRDGQDNAAEIGAGVRISNSQQIKIIGNDIENMRRGVHVGDVGGETATTEALEIIGNSIKDVTVEGIDLSTDVTATRTVHIIGNAIDGVSSTEEGIVVADCVGCYIVGNEIWAFDKDGINIDANSSRINIQANAIRGNGGDGINTSADQVAIDGNQISGNTGDGIDIAAASTNVSITGNVFSSNTGEDINNPTNASNGSVIRDNTPEQETATGTFTLNPSIGTTIINSSGGAVTGTLGNGVSRGDQKLIVMTEASNPSTVSVTNHVTSDPVVFTFNAVDEAVLLMWTGSEWMTVHLQDATV